LVYTRQEWLHLDTPTLAQEVSRRISTAVVYFNGTRRWFLSQHQDWADYAAVMRVAQQSFSQLFYDHGLQTLIQPVFGYDLLSRGEDYFRLAVQMSLVEMTTPAYRAWYHQNQVRITIYGNWVEVLTEHGQADLVETLQTLTTETMRYTARKLLLGIFADRYLDKIASLARQVDKGEALLAAYYGQPVPPVDIIVGSGQPAIWDLPLLDINKASLYFLQAPTFCLDQAALRQILYDHLYQRVNDDELYANLAPDTWQVLTVLGVGQQTSQGWVAWSGGNK
jgi:hypothetical protein